MDILLSNFPFSDHFWGNEKRAILCSVVNVDKSSSAQSLKSDPPSLLCFALLCDSIPMSGKIYLGQHLVLIASFIKQILSFAQPNSLLSQIKFSSQMNMMRVKYFFFILISSLVGLNFELLGFSKFLFYFSCRKET
jgi:hypothetical protein